MQVSVKEIVTSESFGKEVNGQKRYIVVVRLLKGGENRLMRGTFTSNSTYTNSIDLEAVYNDVKELYDEDGKFLAKAALKRLKSEISDLLDDVHLYDIDLGATYRIVASGNEMSVHRIWSFENEENVRAYVMRGLKRDLQAKRIVPVTKKNEEKEEEEEE